MDVTLLNHAIKCRCCFQSFNAAEVKKIRITEKFRRRFFDLMKIKLQTGNFSMHICNQCDDDLAAFSRFKQKMIKNQERLEEFEMKMNPRVVLERLDGEQEADPINVLTIKAEPLYDDLLPDEIFKVEDLDVKNFKEDETELDFDTAPWDGEVEYESLECKFDDPRSRASSKSPNFLTFIEEQLLNESKESKSLSDDNNEIQKSLPRKRQKRKEWTCECGETFAWRKNLREHEKVVHKRSQEEFRCSLCDKTCASKSSLSYHRSLNHTTKKSCEICGVPVATLSYKAHLKRHNDLGCINISKEALKEKKLQSKASAKKPRRICQYCGKSLDWSNFFNHIAVHVREMNNEYYFCDHCDYKTYRKKLIYRHMGVHAEKTIKCSKCPKLFSFTDMKTKHEKICQVSSEEKRRFKCHCEKTFYSKDGLGMHLKNHHQQMHLTRTEFPCSFCKKVFDSKRNLIFHRKEFHKPKQNCEICGVSVLWGNMTNHIVNNHKPMKCTFEGCNRELNCEESLKHHIKYHHMNSPSECPVCGVVFASKIKLRTHVRHIHDEKKYKCLVVTCDYLSSRRFYMDRHYRHHKGIDEDYRAKLLTEFRGTAVRAHK